MERRAVFNTAIAAGAASLLAPGEIWAEDGSPPLEIVDTNVSLFRWPFRRLPLDETDVLVEKLGDLGITRAFAGSFEGIFYRDIRSANRRLANAAAAHGQLVPIGSINPELPGWEDDLKRCHGDLNMPGIRLHPNYHGYTLEDGRFSRLLKLAVDLKLFVQIVAALEDTRTQPAKLQVADVDLTPLPEILKQHAGSRVQILNWRPRGAILESLAENSGVVFDTARVESTDGIATLLKTVPAGRVMFGTHAPFLIPEAALIRIHESNLSDSELRSVLHGNARQFRI